MKIRYLMHKDDYTEVLQIFAISEIAQGIIKTITSTPYRDEDLPQNTFVYVIVEYFETQSPRAIEVIKTIECRI